MIKENKMYNGEQRVSSSRALRLGLVVTIGYDYDGDMYNIWDAARGCLLHSGVGVLEWFLNDYEAGKIR